MKLVVFSKELKDLSITQMIAKAHKFGLEGYDLAVRPGYAVNPDNAGTELSKAVAEFKKESLAIPMITARGDLLNTDDPDVRPLLSAMDKGDVRLLKLGYYTIKMNGRFNYWQEVDKLRKIFEKWAKLGKEYGVRILYHTHSSAGDNEYLGSNASNLMHLIKSLDPAGFGAYLDAGHLSVEGERFSYAVAIVGEYLKAVALKDVLKEWDNANDCPKKRWVKAGEGRVDWNAVFTTLVKTGYNGPASIHCEYEHKGVDEYFTQLPNEVAFFRRKREMAESAKS
ncbi:MAG: sugar phosphate isomerase/epimerase [Verrucomicrobia bacterium]|nr:sugar phosphate isomerase/epimerase [Verrucomicrobiota bacterium]MBU1735569.1 sugar phosphate isomerase/epimerase [Verrucomicrobiota bacterium]MBU1856552.1 sugar phosphate isomerase/epimerase [Verrucomicrobiota bacterium]